MKLQIKLLAILLIFSGCLINLTAQIAYYDALELSKKCELEDGKILFKLKTYVPDLEEKEILKILALYDKNLNAQSSAEDIMDAYNDSKNPFISISIPEITNIEIPVPITPFTVRIMSVPTKHFAKLVPTSEIPMGDLPESPPSSASGIFDTTTVVEGIAKFLVGRVKEELSAAFFKKFKDEITKDKYKIYKNLFPETFKMLETIDEEIYKFSSYIQVLREAFEKDLNNAYENLPAAFNRLMEDDKIKKFFDDRPWLEVIFNSGFYIIDSLKKEKHPGDILADFKTDKLTGDSQNLGNALELLKIISYSLRKESGDQYWIDKDDLKKLVEPDNNKQYVTFKIYLGLIYQKAKNIKFKVKNDEILFPNVLTALKKPIEEIEDVNKKIAGFMYRVGQLETSLKDLKEMTQKDKKPTYNDYFKFYNATLDTLEYSLEFFEYFLDKVKPTNIKHEEYSKGKIVAISEVKKYLGVARAVGDIYLDIKNKNFSSVIFNVIKIFDNVILPAFEKEGFNKIRAGLLKYGSFLATVAKAQNSDEVKEAIAAVVLPAGSSSIKRNSSFNISLNAYVGASAFKDGKFEESEESNGKEFLGFNKARVWAPIGIAFSAGKINIPCIKEVVKSFSLFASIIDIGAVTAFRFTDENAEEIPKFTLKNIISPGLHVILGIKNLPISFGVGYQRLPQLEKIEIINENEIITTINTENRWKWNFFIAVDIPLLNFMTK